jgi:uncharacterized membrane protein (UPF0127 family)
MTAKLSFVLLLLIGVCAGCGKDAAPEPSLAASAIAAPMEPTRAQPKLQTLKLYIGQEEMVAELALTEIQQQTGMMFRTNMEDNTGMLFPLRYTQRASFWMKNCPYHLSAAYIDPDGIIEEIRDLQPYNTNSVVAASNNIRFVLETPYGWFEKHHIGPGVAIVTERGALMQTFFPKR